MDARYISGVSGGFSGISSHLFRVHSSLAEAGTQPGLTSAVCTAIYTNMRGGGRCAERNGANKWLAVNENFALQHLLRYSNYSPFRGGTYWVLASLLINKPDISIRELSVGQHSRRRFIHIHPCRLFRCRACHRYRNASVEFSNYRRHSGRSLRRHTTWRRWYNRIRASGTASRMASRRHRTPPSLGYGGKWSVNTPEWHSRMCIFVWLVFFFLIVTWCDVNGVKCFYRPTYLNKLYELFYITFM